MDQLSGHDASHGENKNVQCEAHRSLGASRVQRFFKRDDEDRPGEGDADEQKNE